LCGFRRSICLQRFVFSKSYWAVDADETAVEDLGAAVLPIADDDLLRR
jgi:hypothetical protein